MNLLLIVEFLVRDHGKVSTVDLKAHNDLMLHIAHMLRFVVVDDLQNRFIQLLRELVGFGPGEENADVLLL